MSKSVQRVRTVLEETGVPVSIQEMPASTRTAQAAADAIGCALDQIAKSVIFRGTLSDRPVLFITAGGNTVDAGLAARHLGETLEPAKADFVRRNTGFAIGGVAPIGHLHPSAAAFDKRLLDFDAVWAAAGTPNHVFEIEPGVLQKISSAYIVDFTV